MLKGIFDYLRNWIHWIIYGEWWVGIVTEDEPEQEVEIKEYSEKFDDSVVATPFIQSGFSQK